MRSMTLYSVLTFSRSLSVTIHNDLSMHTSKKCVKLHAIKKKRYVISGIVPPPDNEAKQIAVSKVFAILDYCNAILYEISQSNLSKQHRVQNSHACVVTNGKISRRLLLAYSGCQSRFRMNIRLHF